MNKIIRLSAFVSVLFCLFISISAFAGTVQYTYDSLNRIVKVVRDNEIVIEYTYDASGNRQNIKITSPGDIDGDKDIDGTDLASFIIGYNNGNPLVADLDGDHDVDADDLKLFALNFGK